MGSFAGRQDIIGAVGLPPSLPLLFILDDTVERRKGKKIKAKGCYRDAVRSTNQHVIKCFGLKWLPICLLLPLPWSSRPWALPFLVFLQHPKKYNEERKHKHRTSIDYAKIGAHFISQWLPKKLWTLLGDGGFVCLELIEACIKRGGTLIARLRLDSTLRHFQIVLSSNMSPYLHWRFALRLLRLLLQTPWA